MCFILLLLKIILYFRFPRNIHIHTSVVKYNDTNKDNFLIKNVDSMRVCL